MKVKSRIILALLVCAVALTYTACKKTSAVSTSTVDSKTVSKQIALNLAQTLYGGLGGFDLSSGLNAPNGDAVITRHQLTLKRQQMALKLSHGRQINDTGDDILCGLSEDTTLNYSATLDDGSTASIKGSIGYTFICTNSIFSGFNVRDNLIIGESNSSLTATYNVAENLTILAKNPNDDNSSYTLGGTVNYSGNIAYKTGSKATTSESYDYNFTNPLLIDSSGTIESGSATFATKGSNSTGNWNYSGTIEFLGGYNVKITINGATYNVNINTGVVS